MLTLTLISVHGSDVKSDGRVLERKPCSPTYLTEGEENNRKVRGDTDSDGKNRKTTVYSTVTRTSYCRVLINERQFFRCQGCV